MTELRPECPLVLFPHSGRRRGGDIACAVTFDVKARTRKTSAPVPAGALCVMCIVSGPSIKIVFPFQKELIRSVHSPQLRRNVEIEGDFCPVIAGQVFRYPQPLVIKNRCFVGGEGIVVGSNFIPFRRERCPLTASTSLTFPYHMD